MFIREVHIDRFRHLRDVHLGPFQQPPEASDVVALAGPNGGGKSSVLELLGYALSNTWSLAWSLSRTFPEFSFEVQLGLKRDERELIRTHLDTLSTDVQVANQDVLEYLRDHDSYYRSYNFEGGQYQPQANLYNKVHGLVTSALREQYGRSIGFFLKSDRTYPSMSFQRERLFAFDEIGKRQHIWGMAFNTSEIQYRDMFEFLVQQRYHYVHRLGAYYERQEVGDSTGEARPEDPLKPYAELLEQLFPQYRFVHSHEEIPTGLYVQLPTGEIVLFSDLSSGEKEVFFILSFFLRHDVSNAVVVIDEPELHLHPQLARLLIRTMESIRPGNQLWVATHNGEIVDEAGRDRVVYIARSSDPDRTEVIPGTSEPEAITRLRDLFGYSGYVGIARTMVFLEGLDSSSDRKMFASLFPQYSGRLKFVPAQSSENLGRLNMAILSILESALGWMDFYLIRDHDFLTTDAVEKYRNQSSGRLFVLERYHIENYLLNDTLVAETLEQVFGIQTAEADVRARLRSAAHRVSGEVLRDMIAFRLNLIFRPEDFSMGRFLQGQPVLDERGEWIPERVEALDVQLLGQVKDITDALAERASDEALRKLVDDSKTEVLSALRNDDGWRRVFPGRRLLGELAKGFSVPSLALQNALIRELSSRPDSVPGELIDMIRVMTQP